MINCVQHVAQISVYAYVSLVVEYFGAVDENGKGGEDRIYILAVIVKKSA